jgi:hypothetical protein
VSLRIFLSVDQRGQAICCKSSDLDTGLFCVVVAERFDAGAGSQQNGMTAGEYRG